MRERSRPPQTNRALRLIIKYDDGKIVVSDRQYLEKATPPSDALRGYEGQSGFWYELRDAKRKILYRRVASNPIQFDVEVHDPETGPRRYPVRKARGLFTVLVPDLPEADSLVLVSSPLDPRKRMASAKLLARIPLREKRRAR
jgi:hypothetical protein